MKQKRFSPTTWICAAVLCTFSLAVSPDVHGTGMQEERASVVATTSWTAAFVRAAGVDAPYVLAPYELRHPAEYELKPSDIHVVTQADVVVFSGYENMVSKIKDAVGGVKPKLLQIATDYRMETIRRSVLSVAEAVGDRSLAENNIRDIDAFYAEWREQLRRRGILGGSVLVHFFQRPLAEELGFDVLAVFGPGPLEARQIAEMSEENPVVIIDNWHNPTGTPLIETIPDSAYVTFINFPGEARTVTLLDVLEYNRAALEK